MADAAPAYGEPALKVLSTEELNEFFAIGPAYLQEITHWLQDRADSNERGLSRLDRPALADIARVESLETKMRKLLAWINMDGSGNRAVQVSSWIDTRTGKFKYASPPVAKAVEREESPVRLSPRERSRSPPKTKASAPLPSPPFKEPVVFTRMEIRNFFSGRPQALIEACEEIYATAGRPIDLYDTLNERSHSEKMRGLVSWSTGSDSNREVMRQWMEVRAPHFK